MKKSIKLTETDLENIILRILKEQTGPGITSFGLDNSRENARVSKQNENISLEKKYPCIPEDVRPFAEYVVQNKQKLMSELGVDANTLLFMAKAAIGIIGRETLFRTYSEWSDDAAEFLHSIGFGFLPKSAVGGLNLVNKISGKPQKQMSLGSAQFTEKTWNDYGLDKKVGSYSDSFSSLKQGIGTLHRINDDYKRALKVGNGTGPSVNPIAVRTKGIKGIDGTGNNAMDLAIVAHNMPGLITRWCETKDPNYAAPCDKTLYQPFPQSKPELKIMVLQNKPIANYFPNKGSGQQTSIGYLEKVVRYMNSFGCLKF
jgi:hypothetical protein